EGDRADVAGVALELRELLVFARGDPVQPGRLVGAARGQHLAVGRVGDGEDGLAVAAHGRLLVVLGAADVEDADGGVGAGGGDDLCVGGAGGGVARRGGRGDAVLQLEGLASVGDVPDVDGAVGGAGDEGLVVLREGDGGPAVADAGQREQAHVGRVPDAD